MNVASNISHKTIHSSFLLLSFFLFSFILSSFLWCIWNHSGNLLTCSRQNTLLSQADLIQKTLPNIDVVSQNESDFFYKYNFKKVNMITYTYVIVYTYILHAYVCLYMYTCMYIRVYMCTHIYIDSMFSTHLCLFICPLLFQYIIPYIELDIKLTSF